MAARRSLDLAGTLQLVGTAAVFAALWTLADVSYFRSYIPLAAAIFIGIAAACVGLIVQVLDWERLGGREAIVAVNGWIRAGAVPPSVPLDVAMPVLVVRERDALRRWAFLPAAAILGTLAIMNLVTSDAAGDRLVWTLAIVFWTGAASRVLYYNLRWLPALRRLVRDVRRCPAAAA